MPSSAVSQIGSARTRFTPDSPARRRATRGGMLGNYVDQVDIFLPVIALAPVSDRVLGPGSTAAQTGLVFVATLLGRPLGAAIFGAVADRRGRTSTTRIAIAGIAATTAAIALVPGHTTLGAATLWAFVALRFLGGIFLGGEYTAAIPLAMEWSRPDRRGGLSGAVMAMSPLANASIAALTLTLVEVLGVDAYADWAWRVPFAVGALLAAAMLLYYRRGVSDAPAWKRAERRPNPLRDIVIGQWRRQLWQVFVLMTGLWLFTQMAVPVLTGELRASTALDPATVPFVMLIATLVSAVTMLAAGELSQRTGRRAFFVAFGAAAVLLAPLAHALTGASRSLAVVVLGAAALQVVTVTAYGPVGAYLAERFPAQVRSSGYGVGYSLSIVLPALYPFWLPPLQEALGAEVAVRLVLAVAALLLVVGALAGPEPDRRAPLA